MDNFVIYSIGLTLLNGVSSDQIREVLETNINFNQVSITEQERGLAMIIANQGRPKDIIGLVDEVKKIVEAEYGHCFIYDQSVKEIRF